MATDKTPISNEDTIELYTPEEQNMNKIQDAFLYTCLTDVTVETSYGLANQFFLRYNHNTGDVVFNLLEEAFLPVTEMDALLASLDGKVCQDESIVALNHQEGYFWLACAIDPKTLMESDIPVVMRPFGNDKPFYQMPGDIILEGYVIELSAKYEVLGRRSRAELGKK